MEDGVLLEAAAGGQNSRCGRDAGSAQEAAAEMIRVFVSLCSLQ